MSHDLIPTNNNTATPSQDREAMLYDNDGRAVRRTGTTNLDADRAKHIIKSSAQQQPAHHVTSLATQEAVPQPEPVVAIVESPNQRRRMNPLLKKGLSRLLIAGIGAAVFFGARETSITRMTFKMNEMDTSAKRSLMLFGDKTDKGVGLFNTSSDTALHYYPEQKTIPSQSSDYGTMTVEDDKIVIEEDNPFGNAFHRTPDYNPAPGLKYLTSGQVFKDMFYGGLHAAGFGKHVITFQATWAESNSLQSWMSKNGRGTDGSIGSKKNREFLITTAAGNFEKPTGKPGDEGLDQSRNKNIFKPQKHGK